MECKNIFGQEDDTRLFDESLWAFTTLNKPFMIHFFGPSIQSKRINVIFHVENSNFKFSRNFRNNFAIFVGFVYQLHVEISESF